MNDLESNPETPVQPLARRRLTVRRMMIAVAVAGIVLGLVKFLFIDNRPLDILFWGLSSLAGHSTVYAEGYEESKFRSIELGMTIRQVEDIMGEPLDRDRFYLDSPGGGLATSRPAQPGEQAIAEAWEYSVAGRPGGNYWRRMVWFNEGKVSSKFSNYYRN